MLKRRDIGNESYILSNGAGDVAFGNQMGISYLKNCMEEKEVKKYASANSIRLFSFQLNEFSFIAYLAYSIEAMNKLAQEINNDKQ